MASLAPGIEVGAAKDTCQPRSCTTARHVTSSTCVKGIRDSLASLQVVQVQGVPEAVGAEDPSTFSTTTCG